MTTIAKSTPTTHFLDALVEAGELNQRSFFSTYVVIANMRGGYTVQKVGLLAWYMSYPCEQAPYFDHTVTWMRELQPLNSTQLDSAQKAFSLTCRYFSRCCAPGFEDAAIYLTENPPLVRSETGPRRSIMKPSDAVLSQHELTDLLTELRSVTTWDKTARDAYTKKVKEALIEGINSPDLYVIAERRVLVFQLNREGNFSRLRKTITEAMTHWEEQVVEAKSEEERECLETNLLTIHSTIKATVSSLQIKTLLETPTTSALAAWESDSPPLHAVSHDRRITFDHKAIRVIEQSGDWLRPTMEPKKSQEASRPSLLSFWETPP